MEFLQKAWFLFSGERAPLKATFVVIVNNIKQKKIGCTNQLDKPNVCFDVFLHKWIQVTNDLHEKYIKYVEKYSKWI